MERSESSIKIVITVASHPLWGVMLWPYTVEESEEETLTLLELGSYLSNKAIAALTPAEQKAIAIANNYSEKNLMKVFSKEQVIATFLKKLTEENYTKHIRPFIERKLVEMLTLIREESLPLYQHEKGKKILYPHNKICVSPHYTEATFHFEADNTHFYYTLECRQNGRLVSLAEKKPITVLTTNPANLITGNDLHQFQHLDAMRVLPFTHKSRVSVDRTETSRYLEVLVAPILRHHDISWHNLPIFEEKRACTEMLSIEENIHDEPILKLQFNYGDVVFYPGDKRHSKWVKLFKHDDGNVEIRFFKRDTASEQEYVQLLKTAGMASVSDCYFKLKPQASESGLVQWIASHRKMLSSHFHLHDAHQREYCLDQISIEKQLTDSHDWFELHITVHIGNYRIPFIRFRKNILEKRREYLLPDGKVVLLPEEWFNHYTDIMENSEPTNDEKEEIRIKHIYSGLLSALPEVATNEKITYQAKMHIPPPKALKATLRSYQEEGFNWMMHLNKHRLGGCLADDMGLGKTLQTLALLQQVYSQDVHSEPPTEKPKRNAKSNVEKGESMQLSLFDESNWDEAAEINKNERKPATLIVMPTSLLHNWRKEIARFTTLAVYEFTGSSLSKKTNYNATFDHYQIVLTSYGIMRKHIAVLTKYQFEYIVLDESQHIKNSDSITFKAAITLRGRSRLILTGTPIENSLKDLWSQFHFIQPELLGDEQAFHSRFITPIRQGEKDVEEKLHRLISPFILRRRKEEVAPELPPLTEEIVYCGMSDAQHKLYEAEKNSLRNLLLEAKGQKGNNLTVLNGITRLRQLACHPKMVFDDFIGDSGKIEEIVSLFETLQSEGHKVLIFSSFVKHLELIAEKLEQNDWPYALLTGASTKREEEIKRFTDNSHIQAFLISLKAGGVGLNLTEADYVFIIDPWWNPASELQAISRAHRIGQKRQVFAYRFITEESIEEKITKLQAEKKRLLDALITDNNPLLTLSDKEWAALI